MGFINTPLRKLLTEYKEYNVNSLYRPVAVGKYGIRTRESIYKKELAQDYSKNKVIFRDTLTVGMGSEQIDIGILSDNMRYSVSPAYHTFVINSVNSNYLRYCLECRNQDMSKRFLIPSARQGKTIDFARWLEYEVPIYDEQQQLNIVSELDTINKAISKLKQIFSLQEEMIKSRFIEMFGDPLQYTTFPKLPLKKTCNIITGNTPSRSNKAYYGGAIEWIKTDNIISNRLYPSKAVECLSDAGLRVGRSVEKDSILMACIAGSVASIGKVCITDRKVAFNQQINAIVPLQYDTMFLYVLLVLCKDYITCDINMAIKGILSKMQLEAKQFILPPLSLQKKFAEFVKLIDKSKVSVQKEIDLYNELFEEKMNEYFG